MTELWSGALYVGSTRLARLIEALRFPVLPFDGEDARRAADIRAYLRRTGNEIGGFDTLIAGQGLARGLTLVIHNTREFARVPGLRLEDWEA